MKTRTIWITFLITTLWINVSETFRYFAFVMPIMREDLAMIPNVAPMNLIVFSIWGAWGTLLTLMVMWIVWLCIRQLSSKKRVALIAGTTMWACFFVLFWLGLVNMNLAKPSLALCALPLAWIEMVVAAWLAQWSYERFV
jgi:hypothetical protein